MCITIYRVDSSKKISKLFNYDAQAIIVALKKYVAKDQYHGHASGKPGGKEAPLATKNLDAAIAFLEKHAPKGSATPSQRKGPNAAKKRQSQANTAALKLIIQEGNDLGKIERELTEADPDWKGIRSVLDSYNLKRRIKGKQPIKNKK